MFPSTSPPLRYLRAVRRARVVRLAATGAVVLLPLACGGQDDVFDAAPVEAGAGAETTVESSAVSTGVADPTDVTTTESSSAEATTSTTSAAAGTSSAVMSEMVVDLTYVASSGQRADNPYLAVWIEDTEGNLVQTVSLWFEQSGKGTKWLNELRGWYAASGGDVITSGATRAAGTYSVVWDGTGLDGQPVAAGEYVLVVESAREHGPYSVTSSPITLDGTSVTVSLPDDGELSGVSATVSV